MDAQEEAGYKLCKVKRAQFGKGGVPYITVHDGRTIRYPDPDIKASRHPCSSMPVSYLGKHLGTNKCIVMFSCSQHWLTATHDWHSTPCHAMEHD